MEVIVASSAGFCYGVKRALDTVLSASKASGRAMFILGPLIHNPQVIEDLERQGVKSVKALSGIPAGSTLVMPSHGVPQEVMVEANESGLEIIDVTCPFVRKVHDLARSLVKQGYQVVVLGDEGHTEVKGIMSMAGDDAIAVSDVGELAGRSLKGQVGLIAQTTQTLERYQQVAAKLSSLAYELRAYNTICNATSDRQKAALDVAQRVDVMIIVGGRNSANTKRLAEICTGTGVPSHHVEVSEELQGSWFTRAAKVGITAGASTPDWIIEQVVGKVKDIPDTESPDVIS